jgi:hypothetical protein
LRVVREDGGEPISNRQRVARDSAIIGEIKPVCGEPVRMDEEALNNAVQCADAGRKLGNDAGVRGGIGHWGMVDSSFYVLHDPVLTARRSGVEAYMSQPSAGR